LLGDADPQSPKLAASGRLGLDLAAQGMPVNPKVTKGKVLRKDIYGNPGLVEVPVGKGRILACLTNLGRSNTGTNPDPHALGLWKSLLEEEAGMASRYRFVPTPSAAGAVMDVSKSGDATTPPLFDLSVQVKDDRELYLFLVSFFGPSAGTLDLFLPDGEYSAANALTGEPVALFSEGGKWRLPVHLPTGVGGRAIQIRSERGGKPFTDW
jgi:hypothetical protein